MLVKKTIFAPFGQCVSLYNWRVLLLDVLLQKHVFV